MAPITGERLGALVAISVHLLIFFVLFPKTGSDWVARVGLVLVTVFGTLNWAVAAWRGRGLTDPLFELVGRRLPDRWRLKDR